MSAYTINNSQYGFLSGFFLHCIGVNFFQQEQDFAFYAREMDTLNIPWAVQNWVALKAEDYKNTGKYLHTLLKEIDCEVV